MRPKEQSKKEQIGLCISSVRGGRLISPPGRVVEQRFAFPHDRQVNEQVSFRIPNIIMICRT